MYAKLPEELSLTATVILFHEKSWEKITYLHITELFAVSEGFRLADIKPVGKTDSEHLFCYILNFIEQKGICGWTEEDLI